MTEQTYVDRAVKLLRRQRGKWVDGLVIQRTAGAYAWRTTLSRARRQYQIEIENRQRKVGKRTVSEYRIPRKRVA